LIEKVLKAKNKLGKERDGKMFSDEKDSSFLSSNMQVLGRFSQMGMH